MLRNERRKEKKIVFIKFYRFNKIYECVVTLFKIKIRL
jgi:hypothetical protein